MPRDPDKHIRGAIDYMEEKGWKIKKSNGHAWGRAYCPGGEDGCRPPSSILSTPASPENHATRLRKIADQCPHCLTTDFEKGA